MDFKIRPGRPEDVSRILQLIKELAEYEKAPEEVDIDEKTLLQDGFGENPVYGIYVAEDKNGVQGIALYYFRYSTWKGKTLFLEDIIVTEAQRGRGLGKELFETMIRKARKENCKRMSWQVLEWNEPAIKFYNKYHAKMDGEWLNCDLFQKEIENFKG